MQDKGKEIEFFNRFAAADDYNAFNDAANAKLIDSFISLSALPAAANVLDLGCGSGTFTNLLCQRGYNATGLDLSPKLLNLARRRFPHIAFVDGDVEDLPFQSGAVDGVLLSGIVHHLPMPQRCSAEVYRVLRPGGHFLAFDPNRANPFMYLYRVPSSPLYSSVGVTVNERPICAQEVAAIFTAAGFRTSTDYLAGLGYRYVSSRIARLALPIYNFLDRWLFCLGFMEPFSPFVLTHGVKE
jgi:ubiquinone/menaquinone biosynthesis C-methylase UbiE